MDIWERSDIENRKSPINAELGHLRKWFSALHERHTISSVQTIKDWLGEDSRKKRYFLGITKSFLACQIHPKMLKHVLQRWGGDI